MSVQLAITLSPTVSAVTVANNNPALTHVGQVGQLADVQLFSVPKAIWETQGDPILAKLKSEEGVLRVDVQKLERRTKRDEF